MPGSLRIAIEVEVGDRRDVAAAMHRAAGDDHAVDDLGDRGIPPQQAGEIRERPQGDDRDLPRIGADRLPHHLLRHMPAMELGPRQVDAAQPVAAIHVEWLFRERRVGWSDADSRQPRRIEVGHERLQVAGGLLGENVATGRRNSQHLQSRIEEGHGQCHGVVNPGVEIQDHLAWHGGRLLWRESFSSLGSVVDSGAGMMEMVAWCSACAEHLSLWGRLLAEW
jgi:hypothetical protein